MGKCSRTSFAPRRREQKRQVEYTEPATGMTFAFEMSIAA
jgi:hypothetical protein